MLKLLAALCLFSPQIFAHSDLGSYLCESGQKKIQVEALNNKKVRLTENLNGSQAIQELEMPKSHDQFEPQKKQIFDTYKFVSGDQTIELWVPETEGPDKLPYALHNRRVLPCKVIGKR